MASTVMPPLVPLIPVELDRPRHLLFSRRAVKQIEIALSRAWGKEQTFYSAMRDLATMLTIGDPAYLSFTTLSIVLWQGLVDEDPTLTLAQTEDAIPYMDLSALVQLAGKVLEAWQAVSPPQPPVADEVPADADPLAVSTGGAFGPSSAPSLVSVSLSSGDSPFSKPTG